MSSKQQFKEKVKTDKQIISGLVKDLKIEKEISYDLSKKLRLRERVIDEQRLQIKLLQNELNKKQWWKFWK
jgi:hypothetical protein